LSHCSSSFFVRDLILRSEIEPTLLLSKEA
jgi:hypothetical protein